MKYSRLRYSDRLFNMLFNDRLDVSNTYCSLSLKEAALWPDKNQLEVRTIQSGMWGTNSLPFLDWKGEKTLNVKWAGFVMLLKMICHVVWFIRHSWLHTVTVGACVVKAALWQPWLSFSCNCLRNVHPITHTHTLIHSYTERWMGCLQRGDHFVPPLTTTLKQSLQNRLKVQTPSMKCQFFRGEDTSECRPVRLKVKTSWWVGWWLRHSAALYWPCIFNNTVVFIEDELPVALMECFAVYEGRTRCLHVTPKHAGADKLLLGFKFKKIIFKGYYKYQLGCMYLYLHHNIYHIDHGDK